MLDSCSIHRGWLLLDSISALLNPLRFSCMHCFSYVLHLSFILLSIASCFIIFMHLYGFFVPPWSSLIIFTFLEWSFLASYTPCQLWQKGGEILENMRFLFKILHVRERNTRSRKGEMCFILLGECLLPSSCTPIMTIFTYIVLIFEIYIYMYVYDDVCLLHRPLHVLFLFSLYTHVSYYLYAIFYFCFTQRCLDEFC